MAKAPKHFYQKFDANYFAGGQYDTYLRDHVRIAEEDIVEPLISLLRPKKDWTLLDVGSAMGGAIVGFRKRGFRCEGVDISAYCLENSPVKEHMQYGEAFALPFPAKSFDVVYCSDVFQYLLQDQAFKSIAEFIRVARRYVALWVFSGANSPGWSQQTNPDPLRNKDTQFLTAEDYQNAFAEHGATQIDFTHWKPEVGDEDFTPLWRFVFKV